MRRHAFALAAVALVAGMCSDSGVGPNPLSGSVSFTYSRGVSGSFSASGMLPISNQQAASWAAGERDEANATLFVEAFTPRSASTHDELYLSIHRLDVGTMNVGGACTTTACTLLTFTYGASNATSSYDNVCTLMSGTITISAISQSRAQGSFSGTGGCFPLGGAPASTFTVAGGSFDVPLITSVLP